MKTIMKVVGAATLAVALVVLPAANAEGATLLATFDGSDCAGVFGDSFSECKIPALYDANQTPVIAKWDAEDGTWEVNDALFPSVTGGEWSINLDTQTWTYTPGPNDPFINFFVVKYGNEFDLYSTDGNSLTGTWNLTDREVSHLTFYDTNGTGEPMPEPATLALLGLALVGAGIARRRRQ